MEKINRRQLAKGMAWATPVIVTTATIPAYAASQYTGKATNAYLFTEIKSRTPAFCNKTSNPQQGYISTVDKTNDPSVSIGLWLEGQAGSVRVDTAKIQYIFNHPVQLTDAPTGMNWTTKTTTNGWTVTQPTPYIIQFEKVGMVGDVSTSEPATGTNFGGYFQNFRVLDGCFGSGVVTVKTSATVVYTDSTGQHTYTKNTQGQGI